MAHGPPISPCISQGGFELIIIASGKFRKGGKRCSNSETFHRGPEGSTPSRQRRASQPEASLAGMVATSFSKRRQQAPKPRGSPDIVLHAEALAVDEAGAASKVPLRQGAGDSAGVLDRGKSAGRIAWEPEMAHSRPRGSEPAMGIAGRTMILARCGTSTRSGALASASTKRGGIAWAPEANQISDR